MAPQWLKIRLSFTHMSQGTGTVTVDLVWSLMFLVHFQRATLSQLSDDETGVQPSCTPLIL